MKKRYLIFVLCAFFTLFGLTSCNTTKKDDDKTNQVEEYTVTFNSKGGSAVSSQTVKAGEKAKAPTAPTREGYDFKGWYTDEACTSEWKFDVNTVTANTTLYAKWEAVSDEESYSITYVSEHGTTPDKVNEATVLPDPLPTLEESGWEFKGWYTTSTFEESSKVVAGATLIGDVTLYAKWEEVSTPVVTYSITYVSDHGTKPEDVAEATTLPDPLPSMSEPGWDFFGWYTTDTFEESSKAVAGATLAADATLYAKWEAAQYDVNFVLNGHGKDIEGLTGINQLPTTLPAPTAVGCHFDGWYLDKNFETAATAGTMLANNVTLYAKWSILPNYEEVTYTMLAGDLTTGKSTSDTIVNKYTIGANTEIRGRTRTWKDPVTLETLSFTKSIKLGGSADRFTIDAPGEGKLYIWIQNGSSSADYQNIILSSAEGPKTVTYVGNAQSSPVVRLEFDVVEGQYIISRTSGTSDIYKAEMVCVLEKAEESGFEIVSQGIVDYISIPGQTYDPSKLQLNKVYGNGRTETLDITDPNVVIDSSAFSSNPGEYKISVRYKEYEAQSFTVTVYQLDSIRLGFNATEKLATNTSAGNGVYFNQTVQRVYKLNSALDTSYLSVTAVTSFNSTSKEFLLGVNEYDVDKSFDSSTSGKKTVTITVKGTSISESFDVYVVSAEPSVVNDVVQVKVDGSYTGEIGAVVDEFNTFNTIQQALDYLENLGNTYDAKKKLIVLAAGTYKEKLEVTLPNVELRGAGKDVTLIEWNSLYGVEDESGYVQTTDSCSTFNVREKAVNMLITDVTISNYWNSLSVFDKDLGVGYAEHRALALLVQADQFVMKNCKLLGYQDTVEFFTGRQFLENTYISGTTDFIFGTNNTTYFKNCTIHSITNGKTDGGYITAFKGCNKGANDFVTYGAIFDGCHFTADADVVANRNTSIGRCWGAYAAVMVMNSTLEGHISTQPFTGSSKNQRYVSMNAKPTDPTVKFFEYNNDGAGSIAASIAGVTVLTDATAAGKYADFSVIFGTTNGKVSYSTAWSPTLTTPEEA